MWSVARSPTLTATLYPFGHRSGTRRYSPLVALFIVFLFIVFFALLSLPAYAVEIRVLEADALEVRPISVPGGGTTELIIISGSPVRMEIDGDAIIAEYLEFDREARLLRIVGPGEVGFAGVVTQGRDYLLDLSSEGLNVQDVVIFTAPLDIRGVQATRMPGQIDISAGAFSPCSRCDQAVQDYRFSADRLTLFPGDRLIAYGVTVFLRELPSGYLPVMVVPLGPEERRPRFSVSQGSATTRAEAALDWPYVFGADAFGTLSLRYYADVTPGASSGPAEGLLGGRVDENYLGGGFDGRFYTARGEGEFGVFYTPSFKDEFEPGGKTRDELQFTLGYATQEALSGLQLELLLDRDDTVNQRIFTYTARLGGGLGDRFGGFGVRYVTQGFFDLDPEDNVFLPNYSQSEGALRTFSRLQLSPQSGVGGGARFSVGPFTLSDLRLDFGFFEDFANPSNVSALDSPITLGGSPIVRHARLLEAHTLTLAPLSPFPGSSLSGRTTFTGQYYTSQNTGGQFERLIDWNTSLNAEQDFGIGSLSFDFRRNLLEGETPFRFDARTTPNSRTDLTSTFRFRPAEWLNLQISETYVFEDSRSLDVLGAGPIDTRLTLFGNLNWLNVTLEQSYDVAENDPGVLGGTVDVRSPEDFLGVPVRGRVRVDGTADLNVAPDNLSGALENESEVAVAAELGYSDLATLGASVGYDFGARPGSAFGSCSGGGFSGASSGATGAAAGTGELSASQTPQDRVPCWRPLTLNLSSGSLLNDELPGARVFYQRDLNVGRPEALGLELSAGLGPLWLSAEQRFDLLRGVGDAPFFSADASLFQITWPEVVQLSGTGFALIPPSLLGLASDPEISTSYELSLLDQSNPSAELYELSFQTSYGPIFNDFGETAGAGFSNTSVSADVALPYRYLQTDFGAVGFGVQFLGQFLLADDELPLSYFSSSNLTLTTDFFSRVGLQGSLSYGAAYSAQLGDFSQSTLTLQDFGVTARVLEGLYLSALLNDVWDFTGTLTNANRPFNLQPIIYVTLNRCCWALYGALDTRDGTLSLTLGYPGSGEGLFESAFETPLALPRRTVAPVSSERGQR